ncbi:MAG: hypothetical protein D6719_06365 [Candidatus Dadabacteria bacterium]|nr:MAG: hypothetical protein D6719_06365 [Candidatus Dadabacteria bacterium]
MNRGLGLLLCIYCLCTFVHEVMAAAPESNFRLESLRHTIKQEEQKLQNLREKRREISIAVDKLKNKLNKIRADLKSNASLLKKSSEQIDNLVLQIKSDDQRIAHLKRIAIRRLKAIYITNSNTSVGILTGLSDISNLSRNAYYLNRIRSFDLKTISKLKGLLVKRTENIKLLKQKKKAALALKMSLSGKKEELDYELRRQEKLLTEFKQKEDEINESLSKLQAEALRLETVVLSLAGEVNPGPDLPGRKPKNSAIIAPSGPYRGEGLFRQKGSLVLPVVGRVKQGFGRRRYRSFKDMVFYKGIEFTVKPQSPVKAIARGRVAHAGRLPGYGTIVIIDHGRRYYSLYGRLGKVMVERGNIVKKGAIIADTNDEGSFYFEIRKNGTPVNPNNYYRGRLK